jgi:tRNA (Thr-GGU) A37 N-methylase
MFLGIGHKSANHFLSADRRNSQRTPPARACRGRAEVSSEFSEGLSDLDGTPLLGIKPYTEKFDGIAVKQSGYQDEVNEVEARQRGYGKDKTA